MANRWFYCEKWHQQITEDVCIHRYKKGYKKCEGCQKGKDLLELRMRGGQGCQGIASVKRYATGDIAVNYLDGKQELIRK